MIPFSPFALIKGLGAAFGGIWNFVRDHASLIIIGGLLLWVVTLKADVATWQRKHDRVVAARAGDAAARWQATYDAAMGALKNIQKVERQRAAISERTVHEVSLDRAHADQRYRRLLQRVEAAKANPGGAHAAGLPALSDATCRIVAGTGCDAIPALLKAAQDNTDLLLQAQHWMREQAKVETGADAP